MRDGLLDRCAYIEEYSTYTAEAHHLISTNRRRLGNVLQIGPAVIAAGLGALTATGCLPLYGAWLTAAAAVFTACANILNPFAEADSHLSAGKAFTVLKHDASFLRNTLAPAMSDEALTVAVKALHDRYGDLVRQAPPTTDKEFETARQKVKSGIHESDDPKLRTRR
jgi:hypothetical protein